MTERHSNQFPSAPSSCRAMHFLFPCAFKRTNATFDETTFDLLRATLTHPPTHSSSHSQKRHSHFYFESVWLTTARYNFTISYRPDKSVNKFFTTPQTPRFFNSNLKQKTQESHLHPPIATTWRGTIPLTTETIQPERKNSAARAAGCRIAIFSRRRDVPSRNARFLSSCVCFLLLSTLCSAPSQLPPSLSRVLN